MVKFINKLTGTEMYVDESRVNEYLGAGHRRADEKPPKTAKIQVTVAPEAPKKKAARKK